MLTGGTNDAVNGCVEVTALPAVTFSGLTNGERYDARVLAVNARGASPWSGERSITPNTLPGVPSDLRVEAVDRGLQAHWISSTSSAVAVNSYIVVYKNNDAAGADYPALTGSGAAIDCPSAPDNAASGCRKTNNRWIMLWRSDERRKLCSQGLGNRRVGRQSL